MNRLLTVIAAMLISGVVFAQQQQQFPRAVLVQLRSESNRITALTKAHRYRQVEEVKADAQKISMAMIKDFKENFHYCPVYYFMDTNLNQILEQRFDGILFESDSRIPATNIIVHPGDTDYVIAFYGFPVVQGYGTGTVRDISKYQANSGEPFGRGLVINNYKMQQVHYFYKLGYENFLWSGRKKNKRNVVTSDHFDMEYFPFAKSFQKLVKSNWTSRYETSTGE
jgi:hypothetical protein